MAPDELLVLAFTLFGIGFTFWFFLMKKEHEVVVKNNAVDIVVSGGYQPDVIAIPKGKTTTINFIRKDPSSCLEEVVLSDFKIRKYLPLHKKISVNISPKEEGEFRFSCGMNMFHGKVKVI